MSQPRLPSVPISKPNVEGVNVPMPTPKPNMEERFPPTVSQYGDYGETFEPDLSPIVRPFAKQYQRDQEDKQGGLPTMRIKEDDITAMAMKALSEMSPKQINSLTQGDFNIKENMPDRYGYSMESRLYPKNPQDKKSMFDSLKNFFRARYNRMGFGEELGEKQRPFLNQDSTQFANGGIVGLRRGGNGFTSNLEAKEKDDAFIESQYDNRNDNPFMGGGSAIGSDAPQAGQQSISIGEKAQQDREQQRQERMRDLQTGFESAFNVNVPNDPFKAMQSRINDPMYQDFLKSQDSPAAKYVNMFGKKVLGYDDPFEMYKATQAQLERNKVADAMRNRDRDRAMAETDMQKPFDPCPEGFTYDSEEQKCVPVEDEIEKELGQEFVRNPEAFTGDPNMYGRVGGEYNFFTEVPGLIKAANGIPRGPTGEIRGQGGPKDDLVGPFMLSDQEYVLPKEMVMAAGGGNYDTGIKQLETMRKNSLNKYGDYV